MGSAGVDRDHHALTPWDGQHTTPPPPIRRPSIVFPPAFAKPFLPSFCRQTPVYRRTLWSWQPNEPMPVKSRAGKRTTKKKTHRGRAVAEDLLSVVTCPNTHLVRGRLHSTSHHVLLSSSSTLCVFHAFVSRATMERQQPDSH